MVTTKHNPKKDIRQLANAILRFSEMPLNGTGKWKADTQYLAEHVAPLAQRMKNRYKSQWKPVGSPRPGIGAKAAKKIKAILGILLLCTGMAQAQTNGSVFLPPAFAITVGQTMPAEKPWFDTIKVIIQVYRQAPAYAIDFGDIKRQRNFVFVGIRGWQVREWKIDSLPPGTILYPENKQAPYPHFIKLLGSDKKTEPYHVWDFKEINW